MEQEHGSRGIIIGDRYRVAGALRRTGLIDAVDLEADRTQAACRVVGVPGDVERVEQWEDAWRAAQGSARLPRLREVVADEDGVHWAVLDASRAVERPLPEDARTQARELGEGLAEAGLDAGDVVRSMLGVDAAGLLLIDGPVWLGGGHAPRAAGALVARLLPEPSPTEPPFEDFGPEAAPARQPVRRARRRRGQLIVPLAIVVVLAAAATVLVLPARSAGTAVIAPAAPARSGDILLGDGGPSSAAPQVVAASVSVPVPRRPRRPRVVASSPPAPAPPVVTVTVMVEAPSAPLPEAVVPELPMAAASPVPDVPLADLAPSLPVVAGG